MACLWCWANSWWRDCRASWTKRGTVAAARHCALVSNASCAGNPFSSPAHQSPRTFRNRLVSSGEAPSHNKSKSESSIDHSFSQVEHWLFGFWPLFDVHGDSRFSRYQRWRQQEFRGGLILDEHGLHGPLHLAGQHRLQMARFGVGDFGEAQFASESGFRALDGQQGDRGHDRQRRISISGIRKKFRPTERPKWRMTLSHWVPTHSDGNWVMNESH